MSSFCIDYFGIRPEKTAKNTTFYHFGRHKVTDLVFTESVILVWEKHWLDHWNQLDISDKKVLAALYWFDLTPDQKNDFSDKEYIEFAKLKEKEKKELVNDPIKMKTHFLMEASPLLDKMIQAALGNKKMNSHDVFAVTEVWTLLKEIISSAKNPAPLMNLKGKNIEDQIDEILSKVSTGAINFEQAKEYMSLVSSGYELQELPKLMAKLERLEN